MLERSEHLVRAEPLELARALQPFDRGDTHLGAEERVFAPAFLDPAPARVADDVDDGRKDQRHAARAPRARSPTGRVASGRCRTSPRARSPAETSSPRSPYSRGAIPRGAAPECRAVYPPPPSDGAR